VTEDHEVRAVIDEMWDALYARDWDRLRDCFTDETIYYDVPVGAAAAARGPKDIEARIRLGFEPLSAISHHSVTTVFDNGVSMMEHIEVWEFPTGERVELPFVSVQHVRDGRITLWKDYWNQATLMDAAPQWWHERLAESDLSWVFDATGIA
jgi:ketosteroid isomerase-like protein